MKRKAVILAVVAILLLAGMTQWRTAAQKFGDRLLIFADGVAEPRLTPDSAENN